MNGAASCAVRSNDRFKIVSNVCEEPMCEFSNQDRGGGQERERMSMKERTSQSIFGTRKNDNQ